MANSDRFNPEYVRLVDHLAAERRARGLTQAEVAARVGTTQSIVSKYERKEVLMDLLDYVRYCLAVGLAPAGPLERFAWTLDDLRRGDPVP